MVLTCSRDSAPAQGARRGPKDVMGVLELDPPELGQPPACCLHQNPAQFPHHCWLPGFHLCQRGSPTCPPPSNPAPHLIAKSAPFPGSASQETQNRGWLAGCRLGSGLGNTPMGEGGVSCGLSAGLGLLPAHGPGIGGQLSPGKSLASSEGNSWGGMKL